MVGILLVGLLIAQVFNRGIHRYEHHKLAAESSLIHAARRTADLIRLVAALQPETRQALIEQYNDPALRMQLTSATMPSKPRSDQNYPKFKLFRTTLYELLGNHQPSRIVIDEIAPQRLSLHVYLLDGTVLVLQTDLTDDYEEGSSILVNLAIILFAIMGFSYVAVLWVTRPLQQLASAAEELGNDINRLPLDETGPIEVSRAARAFNAMQARLIHHIQDRTRLLAAISHDLKTPITRMRLRTELLDDSHVRSRLQKDLDEMESMVLATLDFMQGVGKQEAIQPVDMQALLESIQADAQEMHAEVTIVGAMRSPYLGKPSALKRCISNLVDNALKYGGTATLLVEDNDTACIIRIVDQGPGIPEHQLQAVFTPYFRLESSRNRDSGGTGLGLSIAQDIAEAHGGSLMLFNHANAGLEVVLSLPRIISAH
jgi:signal transduction histidine kinase